MTWFCKMAYFVLGKQGKLLEYCHLVANPRHGPHEPTLMAMRSDGLHTACLAKQRERTQSSLSPGTRYQGQGQRTSCIMYGLITCLIMPEKNEEPSRTRLVAGGDRVNYPFDASMPTADLLTIKLLINSVISTPRARFSQCTYRISIYAHP